MTLNIYNSLTKEKEPFKPLDEEGRTVKMYVCGQTVYDYMHIGHARTYIAFDIVRRYLEFKGYAVKTVINITDVNDKINDRAEDEGRGPWEVAEEFTRINLEDFEALGVKADAYPKASDHITEMIELVETLESDGIAYEVDGDVFFDVHAFEDYGKLSHQDLEDIRPEREDDIVASDKKRNLEDFVLWKSRVLEENMGQSGTEGDASSDDGDATGPTWESPWGEGIPGWHIECSAMATTLLGEQFDIHGGGSDLVFPHHEDEIAQSEAATGKDWVNYWMHSGLVRMDSDKMSKSLGNFVSSRELLEQYGPEVIRLMVAGTHYRKPLDYSEEKLEEAERKLEQLRNTVQTVEAELREVDTVPGQYTAYDVETLNEVFERRGRFLDAMDDDFNAPEALKHLYGLDDLLNRYVADAEEPKRPVLERGLHTFHQLGGILGIFAAPDTAQSEEDAVLDMLLDEIMEIRQQLREEQQYALADNLRDAIENAGVQLEDTDRGTRWKRS